MTNTAAPVLTRQQIENLIPHRTPFLWLDEVVRISETSIQARKFVDPQLEVFRGHYPGFPVLPGVLQCEAAFQAGAVLIARADPPQSGHVPVVTRMNQVQFRRIVRPGETLDVEVELIERVANAYFLKGRVSVDGQVCLRLEFACAAAARNSQDHPPKAR